LVVASRWCARAVQDDDRRSRQGVQLDYGTHPGSAQNLPTVRHLHWPREPVLVHHGTGACYRQHLLIFWLCQICSVSSAIFDLTVGGITDQSSFFSVQFDTKCAITNRFVHL